MFIEVLFGLLFLIGLITIIVVLIIMYNGTTKRQREWKKKINNPNPKYNQIPVIQPQNIPNQPINTNVVIYPYVKKYILTRKEFYFYRELQKVADKYNLEIWTKIRLADIIEVDKTKIGSKDYMKYFNSIQSKHIDFVLSNKKTLKLVTAIELDDKTHQYKDRVERDIFVNNALQVAGVPLIRCYNINELENKLINLLNINAMQNNVQNEIAF